MGCSANPPTDSNDCVNNRLLSVYTALKHTARMMLKRSANTLLGILASVFCFLPGFVQAAGCSSKVATLVSIEGKVDTLPYQSSNWVPSSLGDTYCLGDRIRVGRDSRASLELNNDTIIRLDQLSTLLLPKPKRRQLSFVELLNGALHLISRVRTSLEIRTPFVNAGLEGTEFVVRILADQTIVSVLEGKVSVTNALGRISLAAGQTASATKDSPPVLRLDIRPKDTVHWALYYPLVIDPKQPGEARKIRKAQRLLMAGRADKARALLDTVPANDRAYPQALALAAVIALAQNAKKESSELVERAVAAAPTDDRVLLALSYVQQADFDLTDAKSTVESALKANPKNALSWARLAELSAALGDTNAALAAAHKAVELAPKLSRTQTVLGFVALTRLELDDASAAFEKAIQLDSTDPLARMGQALAKIRRGDLQSGRRDLEIAASLDPSNSLVRSYLGKAYFEEKRDRVAGVEFGRAKELDPLDPTPWLYDAILKQTTNRPVEAAKDLQRSTSLNENRAVYRSRLLLDDDAAIRNANLARIYKDLGLEELAISQAAQSLNLDPINSSAHWLLADSYAQLPRHEIALVSETFQAQLWSPLSSRPLRPSASELALLHLGTGGPNSLSFNEYNELFQRDGISAQTDLIFGSNNTNGFELATGLMKGRVQLGAGAFHYDTDGFRTNSDYSQDAHQFFARIDPSNSSSIQTEYRRNEYDVGDVGLYSDERGQSDIQRTSYKQEYKRLALRQALSLRHQLAFFYVDVSEDGATTQGNAFFPVYTENQANGHGVELQYQFRGTHFRAVTGFSNSNQNAKGVIRSDTLIFGKYDEPIRNDNAYVYLPFQLTDSLSFLLGGAYEHIDDETTGFKRDQLSPKIGAMWHPNPRTNIRAAAFRTMKRPLLANQTIEPTQLFGFNQLFDDVNGAYGWRYGAAIDHTLSDTVKAGVLMSWRNLDEPIVLPAKLGVRDHDVANHNAYLSWTPTDAIAVAIQYFYEKETRDFNRGVEDFVTPIKRTDHLLPISLTWFDTSGCFARATTTYINQKVDFSTIPGIQRDASNFTLADLSVGYRLPKRWGLVALDIKNVFDRDFSFHDVSSQQSTGPPRLPRFLPERNFRFRISIAF